MVLVIFDPVYNPLLRLGDEHGCAESGKWIEDRVAFLRELIEEVCDEVFGISHILRFELLRKIALRFVLKSDKGFH
jgi:hypothetical protein